VANRTGVADTRVGANVYLTKPYAPTELSDAIETAQKWKSDLDRGKVHGEIHIELPSETAFGSSEVNEFLTANLPRDALGGRANCSVAAIRVYGCGRTHIDGATRAIRVEAIVQSDV